MDDLEQSFTSTGMRLLRFPDALRSLQEGRPWPITCHVMPTAKCNLNCEYCSVRNRSHEELTLAEATDFLWELSRRGLSAVIISGGGNPLLWSELSRFIRVAAGEMDLRVGLITNGGKADVWRNLTEDAISRLSWLRLSLSVLDKYVEGKKELIDILDWLFIPELRRETTFGCSYIWWDGSDANPKKAIDGLELVRDTIAPSYIRLLPDCLDVERIPGRVAFLEGLAKRLGSPPYFIQHKTPAAPQRCWLGYLHPVLNHDGYVYPCDSLVLNPGADRQFHADWRLCHMGEVGDFYDNAHGDPLPIDPPTMCPGCVWRRHNDLLDAVMQPVPHEEFL